MNSNLDGIVLVDKPKWKTSFNMVALVRRMTREKRVGHIGTLDPFATGLLVIAIGKAVRLVEYLQGLSKVYQARLCLGSTSTSYDPEGTITASGDPGQISEKDIQDALKQFEGDIEQIPPVFSAIKIDGKRAYKSARKGKQIEMPARKVHIDYIKLLSFEAPYLDIEVSCSSGTYIRSLGHDIGQVLKVGAYLVELRRASIDRFCLDDSRHVLDTTSQDIDSFIIPLSEIELTLPLVEITPDDEKKLVYGVQLNIPSDYPEKTVVQLKTKEKKLVAIGAVTEGVVKLSKVLL